MLLEEAYEAFEAVEEAREGRPQSCATNSATCFSNRLLRQVAQERGDFAITDVTEAIHTKMVRRHPHVFADAKEDDRRKSAHWEAIKAEEKRAQGKRKRYGDILLNGVSAKAPALMEAINSQPKAARVGFDWQRIEDISINCRKR